MIDTGQAYNPIIERKPLQRFDVLSDTSPICACYSLPTDTKELQRYTLSGKKITNNIFQKSLKLFLGIC